ncbi:ADP-ribosylglycohydrolase family protein [Streptomyces sp. NPDC058613]|uniref:ADP-ribosylglycohydrolase family protein n=1 Tax=Streptomyces sp. NPDC058613 TaxID=3346556 RepID=UPI00364A1409
MAPARDPAAPGPASGGPAAPEPGTARPAPARWTAAAPRTAAPPSSAVPAPDTPAARGGPYAQDGPYAQETPEVRDAPADPAAPGIPGPGGGPEPRTGAAGLAPVPDSAPRAPRTAGVRIAERPAGPAAELPRPEPRTPADATGGAVDRRRIEGLLLGLAAGDAAGWPAARHRASRMPEWTRRLTRELDTFAEQNATTTLPVPIALNQPPEPLRLGPSDDAEWAAFAAESVLTAAGVLLSDLSRSRRMRAAIDLAWNALASEVAAAAERAPEVESAVLPLRARISVRAGLGNLAAGLRPPATGHDNPHYFDDAACVRACVLAVVHPGSPAAAADLAEFDARYTQDGDGVHGARAMAAAIATALTGADVDAAVEAALAQLPGSTEIGRNARHAVGLARTHLRTSADGGAFAIVPTLEHEIVDHVYSYGIAAAETVPVALALATAARGRVAEAVPTAACLSRVADSAPALAGALTGALGGGDSIPAAWREACRTLSGCALPRLAGTDLVELAALLARTELTSPKG